MQQEICHERGRPRHLLGNKVKRRERLETGPSLTDGGESDHLIVLGDGRAVHMGKGLTVIRSPQRQPMPDNVGPDTIGKPSCGDYRKICESEYD